MNRKIFLLYEGEITECEFLKALIAYAKLNDFHFTFNSIDNIHLLGNETDFAKVEKRFVTYLRTRFSYLVKDAKSYDDLFIYMMDFGRLRPSYDPGRAAKNREKLLLLSSFSILPVRPILSDPSFEFWLYILAASQNNLPIREIHSGNDCHREIVKITPQYLRPTQGAKSYSDAFYTYVLNAQNLKRSVSHAKRLRSRIPQLAQMRNIHSISLDAQAIDGLIGISSSYTMVDLILHEMLNLDA